MPPQTELTGHVVVCGMGHVGFRVVEILLGLRERVVVVTERARDERVRAARSGGATVLLGDARDEKLLAEQASVRTASEVARLQARSPRSHCGPAGGVCPGTAEAASCPPCSALSASSASSAPRRSK
jgi:hypothetical protein